METIELSRKQLYDLVWSTTMSNLTQKYALSRDGFKKICKQFEIPIPQNGYWLKRQYNKKVKIEKLNPVFGGVDKIVLTLREEGSSVNIDQTPLTMRTKEIECAPNAILIVQDSITKPDIITIQTKEYWEDKIKYKSNNNEHIIVYPIRVGDDLRKRALRFMDTFTKLLRYRGHTIADEYGKTKLLIDTVFIDFDLREAYKRVPAKSLYNSFDLVSTGELIFSIGKYSRVKEWRDGKFKIEEILAKIMAKLEIYAEEEKISKEKSRIWNLNYQEELKRKEEIRQRKNQEIEKYNNLVKLSEQYNKTLMIRQYIEEVKHKAINSNNLTPEKQEWINWANDKADWIDPLINKPVEILDNE